MASRLESMRQSNRASAGGISLRRIQPGQGRPAGPALPTVSLQVCLLGDAGCGNTALLECYKGGPEVLAKADVLAKSEVEGRPDSLVATVEVNGEPCTVRFTDNAGSAHFEGARSAALGMAHAVIFCFAVDRPESLQSLEDKIQSHLQTDSDAPTFLLGLRSDLRGEGLADDGCVEQEACDDCARRFGVFKYWECSILQPETVHQVIEDVLQTAKIYYELQWQLGPRRDGNEEPQDDSAENAPWMRHETTTAATDPTPLDSSHLTASLSMLGATPCSQHAYLRVDVPNSGLTSLDIMRSYAHLQFVNVSGNRLRTLEPLGMLRCMLHLNASFNLLIRTQTFAAPDQLETVDLSYNLIAQIGEWSVHKYLRELNLRGNYISRICPGLRRNSELRMLDLSENYIPRVENMDGLGLRILYLAHNRLTCLEGVESLNKLQFLNVRHNNITSISALLSQDIPRLRKLHISENRIACIGEVEGLESFDFLCDLLLAPNPIRELPYYRAQVLHRLPRLRSLDAQLASVEEKVKADVIYGADVEKRHGIFEQLLPEEAFVDRRLVTEPGIADLELGSFGRQGDAGPYGNGGAHQEIWPSYQEQKIRQRLEVARCGGDPEGVADLASFSAPFASPLVTDQDLPQIIEATLEGDCERLLLGPARLSREGVLEVLRALQRSGGAFFYVDLAGCESVREAARELIDGLPYLRGASIEAEGCGLTSGEVLQLRNATPEAAAARQRWAEERCRSEAMCSDYFARQAALEQLASESSPHEMPDATPEPAYRPSRWVDGLEPQARLLYRSYNKANPTSLSFDDSGGGTYSMVNAQGRKVQYNQDQYMDLNRQRLAMLGNEEEDEGEYDDGREAVEIPSPRVAVEIPKLYEQTFGPVLTGTDLIGFMAWCGAKPDENLVEQSRRQREEYERKWKESAKRQLDLTKASKAKYDVGSRPQHVASAQIIAHFTYLCFGGAPPDACVPKPPSHFGLRLLKEAPRPAPFRGEDLHTALAQGRVKIDVALGKSYGKNSVELTLFSACPSEDIEVVVRRGSIFQHVDWQHRQNLMVSLDYVIEILAGSVATKRITAFCMNASCACSNGNPMELTELYMDNDEVMACQSSVWHHFEEIFDAGRA